MTELLRPVVRRKPGDPLLYLCARQSDGWDSQTMAFKSVIELEQSGWDLGDWQTDAHGEYAPLTRPR